ncbi:hypothetical protein ABL78_2832 [Leptomonas seymouri]|uniref:Uncharacterized protein n=1 Tax=Leptomonas seymouri TaxID=5684 RepID=A0A0N0P6V1_LEPSE|nr:hypothetical protein ABL78_2832 [Leptomonas seymouri]|eukprot:KPI88056.1 hypothetical protein ABL78_2832 [Leptomonas seymouri]
MSSLNADPHRSHSFVCALKEAISHAICSSDKRSTSNTHSFSHTTASRYSTSSTSGVAAPSNASTSDTRSCGRLTRQSTSETAEHFRETRRRTERRRGPHPDALPTPNFYERFPRAVGPLANVLIASPEEYQIFCVTARRIHVVSSKRDRNAAKDRLTPEDIAKGGFFVYQPNSDNPEFFLLYDEKTSVYGSASYIRRASA